MRNNFLKILSNNKYLSLTKTDGFKVLEKFNSIVSENFSNIDVYEILKTILIKDLGYNFFALCLKNKEFCSIDVKYFASDDNNITYSISQKFTDNIIIKTFEEHKIQRINNNFTEEFGFDPGNNLKQVLFIPIIIHNKVIAVLSVGSSQKTNLNEIILNLIANQLGLIITNKELKDQLNQAVYLDPLTSLITHSHFQQRLNFEIERSERIKSPVSVLMIDVNNIKQINESHSPLLGDEVISYIAKLLKKNIRDIDTPSRFSGNKLAAILPDKSSNGAHLIADRFKTEVCGLSYMDVGNILVSIGIATYPDNSADKQSLLDNVDKALEYAKKESKSYNKSSIINTDELRFYDITFNNRSSILFGNDSFLSKGDLTNELLNNLHMVDSMQYNSTILLEIISSLAAAIDAKDSYTRGHSQAVAKYAEIICQHLDLSTQEIEKIKIGALMHDIGKIGIPEKVLGKPGQLSDDEWKIMREHPTIGARRIIKPISALHDLIPVVEHHHERWDGTGYPYRLKENEIPLGARVVSIADAFNTMTTDRPYRPSLGYDKAINILQKGSGTQWDSSIINTFLNISKKAYDYVQEGNHIKF